MYENKEHFDIVLPALSPFPCVQLFLGSYRDNEVDRSHPLTCTLQAIQEQGVNAVTIKLGPLERESVNELISETLHLRECPRLCVSFLQTL